MIKCTEAGKIYLHASLLKSMFELKRLINTNKTNLCYEATNTNIRQRLK